MSPQIDKELVRSSFGKHLFSYTQHAVVQASMAEELVWKLHKAHPDAFQRVFEIGCGSGVLTTAFLKRFAVEAYFANDLVEECRHEVATIVNQYPDTVFDFAGGDIERMSVFPDKLDLIISNATFQWLTNLPTFFQRLKQALRPGAFLAFSIFGPDNLCEIRRLTGVGLEYLSRDDVHALLTQHSDVLSCEESCISLPFRSPRSVLRHMRLTGVIGVEKRSWTKSGLREFEQQYWTQFGENEQVPLTYHPILCLVRA